MKTLSLLFLAATLLYAQHRNSSSGPITSAAIDISTQPGVDCTGASDSSPGINTLFASITGHKVVIPDGCFLRVNSQLVIQGQTDFSVEGSGFQPNLSSTTAPLIFGCGASAGPVLYINRSSYFHLNGFGVHAKGASCSSSFTGSIAWANIGSNGYTSTYADIGPGMALETTPNGTKIPGYFAFGVGIDSFGNGGNGGPNLEQINFHDNFIHCQASSGSYGLWIYGGNADNGGAINNRISGCFQAIRIESGSIKLIEKNHFGNNGDFITYGVNGADIFLGYPCSSGGFSIIANEASDGGPFINTNNDVAIGGCAVTMIGNVIGISDISPSAYPINLGAFKSFGQYTLISNQLVMSANTTATAIGSSSQTNCLYGPIGNIVDINNSINDPSRVGGWTGCVGGGGVVIPFQTGEYHLGSPLGLKALVIEGNSYLTKAATMVAAYPDAGPNNPGCNLVGRIWFDTSSTTTVMRVCLSINGALAWAAK